jgi:predicted O-linked N-acetylglucosamine transferase (SPINDLY family)
MARESSVIRLLRRGLASHQAGRLDEAQRDYERVLKAEPRHVDANHFLGVIKGQKGEAAKALQLIALAAKQAPRSPIILMHHGNALKAVGRHGEALDSYDRALAIESRYADAWANRGMSLMALDRRADAVASFRRALELQPGHALASFNLGVAALPTDRELAIACLDRTLAAQPGHADARFVRCVAELPAIYDDEAEIERCRAAYAERLERLVADARTGALDLNGASSLPFHALPFYVAYQGRSDRDLQRCFGTLACAIVQSKNPPPHRLAAPAGRDEPVRIGIVSGQFFNHSVWKMPVRGWLTQLDRSRFRLFCYHTAGKVDAETDGARALSERFVQGPLGGIEAWREEVLRDRPHVLLYPEIGMDPMSAQLAALRLAPVQCTSWGHPSTSGFPTIDYFLSADGMEPPDADEHYTERLVRLPNLSIYCELPDIKPEAIDRQTLGLRPDACVYWCGQFLSKYLPQHDEIFPRIAREVPGCQFLFIDAGAGGGTVGRQFRGRLQRAFAARGLDSEQHCVFSGRMNSPRFSASLARSDIFLDSIGWSGCNTALESTAHDLPIVTMASPFMRGRHSLAILQQMGMAETVAETVDAYVAIAVRLARDAEWRGDVRGRIAVNKHALYRDRFAIDALQSFLLQAAQSPSA